MALRTYLSSSDSQGTLPAAAAVATSNVGSLTGLQVIDGYTLLPGDLVLLTGQTTAKNNGLWVAAAGAWSRPSVMASGSPLRARTLMVTNGTANLRSAWLLNVGTGTITVDSDAQLWIPLLSVTVNGATGAASGQLLTVRSDGTLGYVDGTGINVQAWGAVGNGTTDDTTAFQNAQAICRTRNRPLYVPATTATYKLTAKFTLQNGERWGGDHWSGGISVGTRLQFVLAADSTPGPTQGACFNSSNTLAFNDAVSFEDMQIFGDATHTQVGFFMPSCRYWKFRRVWMTGMTRVGWYSYGQRNATGGIDGTHAGDSTHNSWEHCDAIMANVAGAIAYRLGGTCETDINGNAMSATTITADGGTTITVADGTKISGNAGTLYCQDNGEYINFSGKSGNVLTVIRRAINSTLNGGPQITHPNGTGVAVWTSAGQTNMCTLMQCVGSNSTNGGGGDAFWMEHGTTNTFFSGTSGVGVGGNGFRVSSPGNYLIGGVSENNAGWGVRFDQTYDCYGNIVRGWQNGGTNVLGFILDEGPIVGGFGNNSFEALNTGLKFSTRYQGTGSIGNVALFANTDALLRWRDGQGLDRPAFSTQTWDCPATSLTAGTVTRFRATQLTATPFSTGATIDIWNAEAVTDHGASGGYTVDLYNETTGATLTTPTGLAGAAILSGGSMADGTYFAKLTAINQYGETVASAEANATIAGGGGAGSINWTWNQVVSAGITGYRLYVSTATGTEANYFFIANGTTVAFTQTLSPASGTSGKPPAIDRSGNVFSWGSTFKRGDPLASISGMALQRLSIRLSNPTAATQTVTGHMTWSLRNL